MVVAVAVATTVVLVAARNRPADPAHPFLAYLLFVVASTDVRLAGGLVARPGVRRRTVTDD